MENRPQAHHRASDIDRGLHYIGPDHGGQAALERIDERQYSDDGDGGDFARSERDRHDDRHGIDAHSLGRGSREQKQPGRQGAQAAPKAPFDQFVRSVKIAAKVMRQQHETDHHAPHHIAHHDLQKGEVGVVGKAGNADDG